MTTSVLDPKRCSWFQRMTFSWINPLLQTGRKKTLHQSDLHLEYSPLHSSTLGGQLQICLQHSDNNLWKSLWKMFGLKWCIAGIFKLFKDISTLTVLLFLLPSLLRSIKNSEPYWISCLYIGALFITQLVGSLCLNRYFDSTMTIGLKIRIAVTNVVASKAFLLNHTAKTRYPAASIVNLIASDSYKFEHAAGYAHYIWSGPLSLVIICIFLQQILGWFPLLGMSAIVIMIPIQRSMLRFLTRIIPKISSYADQRLKLTTELVEGIRVVKYYNWETPLLNKITTIRNKELELRQRWRSIGALLYSVTLTLPNICILITIAIYMIRVPSFSFETIIAAFSSMVVVQFVLILYPICIYMIGDALAANKRLQQFLDASESVNTLKRAPQVGVLLENVSSAWSNGLFSFQNLSMHFPHGSLTVVCGRVGAGKSSLLNVIVGEMPLLSGSVSADGSIGYCAQQAWILNNTIQENILLGAPYDDHQFKQAIHLSAFDQDIASFPGGQLAEIGEKGVNLSGGQKQRLSIARMIYSNPDVILMDDSFSALDFSVGNFIFRNLLLEHFKHKTRILVTHRLQFCSLADQVVFIGEGGKFSTGTFESLLQDEAFFLFYNSTQVEQLDGKASIEQEMNVKAIEPSGQSKLVLPEERHEGKVSFTVLLHYLKKGSALWEFAIVLVVASLFQACSYIALFLPQYVIKNGILPTDKKFIIGFVFSIGMLLYFCIMFLIWFARITVRASRAIHKDALRSLSTAKVSFFDANPTGRILNRFSKDISMIDVALPDALQSFIITFLSISISMVISSLSDLNRTWLLLIYALFVFALLYPQSMYRSSARELKRLDSMSLSPIFSCLHELMAGNVVIRLAGLKGYFMTRFIGLADVNSSCSYLQLIAQRWLAIRVEFLSSLLIFSCCMLTFCFGKFYLNLSPDALSASVGIVLGLLNSSVERINWCIRQNVELEISLTSVERLKQYEQDLPQEKKETEKLSCPKDVNGTSRQCSSCSIFSFGRIEFDHVYMKYKPDLDFALHDVSFVIPERTRFAIVGRTGSGKSTIIQCLFRFFDLTDGAIRIDSQDIQSYFQDSYRRGIAVIPQDPTLFTGTIRSNIDPFGNYTDEECWTALKKSSLASEFDSLDSPVAHLGENFSLGQRQLICLARALIKRAKIVVLDEATASVDVKTDALIQEILVAECKDSTIVTIAHRLETILNYDQVIVMHQGSVVERGIPRQLLLSPESLFYQMYRS